MSKNAFGLAVLELYHQRAWEAVEQTLLNDALPPLDRLRAWLDSQMECLREGDMNRGCLYGNFGAEATDPSDAIRVRVAAIFDQTEQAVAHCLRAMAAAGALRQDEVQPLAGVILSSLQGAILVSKAQRSAVPVERFIETLFTKLLRPASCFERDDQVSSRS